MSNVFRNLDWSIITDALISIIPALICITFHEFCHGLTAYKLGDNTAKRMGRLSLNPLKHIDPVGFIMMIVFKFGWAKPVPVDMRNFKNPKRGMAITACAGPVSNIVLAMLFLFIYGVCYPFLYLRGGFSQTLLQIIATTAYISVAFAIFNIIPIPPLDGSKVLFSVISNEMYYKLMRFEKYGMIAIILIFATGILGNPLSTAAQFVFDKLYFMTQLGYKTALLFM